VPTARLPYSDPFGSGHRPYLGVHLDGVNGRGGDVVGLLDTGADSTALPIGFASLMGYGPATLRAITVGTASAPASAFQATQPCTANVLGITTAAPLTLQPVFVFGASASVLWGRSDLMSAFKVCFEESSRHFMLTW
jgi:hypothetical protein